MKLLSNVISIPLLTLVNILFYKRRDKINSDCKLTFNLNCSGLLSLFTIYRREKKEKRWGYFFCSFCEVALLAFRLPTASYLCTIIVNQSCMKHPYLKFNETTIFRWGSFIVCWQNWIILCLKTQKRKEAIIKKEKCMTQVNYLLITAWLLALCFGMWSCTHKTSLKKALHLFKYRQMTNPFGFIVFVFCANIGQTSCLNDLINLNMLMWGSLANNCILSVINNYSVISSFNIFIGYIQRKSYAVDFSFFFFFFFFVTLDLKSRWFSNISYLLC